MARLNPSAEAKSDPYGIWIQNDQLSPRSRLLVDLPPGRARICLVDPTPGDLTYHPQKKKLVLILSLVRHFAEELRGLGHVVDHYRLDCERWGRIARKGKRACLEHFVASHAIDHLRVMQASEYDEDGFVTKLVEGFPVTIESLPNDRFMVGREAFAEWHANAEDPSMESFYEMRRLETNLLMDGKKPEGGQWNYDSENRAAPEGNLPIPDLPTFEPDEMTQEAIDTVEKFFPDHPGSCEGFNLPVRRDDISDWVEDFVANRLRLFGMYQDAMLSKSHVVYHSRLSAYLNHGFIEPMDLLQQVESAYREGLAPINSAEGFVRQILGWREYVHGMYWLKMPEYRDENPLGYKGEIPEMMLTGETLMKCVKSAVQHSLSEGYIHHIERLMIVGNFGLLIGVHPKNLVQWFREMYLDSAEWATLPNVMGLLMATENGGNGTCDSFGSKPYAASAHYIGTMSDYCKGCFYNGKKRLGEKACPFNFLYWNFIGQFQNDFRHNPRMKNPVQMYRLKPKNERELIESSSEKFLNKVRQNGTDRLVKKRRV